MSRPVLLASIALSLLLAGCGNKGPLILPTKPVPQSAEPVAEPPEATGDEVVPTEATERAVDELQDELPQEDPPPPPAAGDGGNG